MINKPEIASCAVSVIIPTYNRKQMLLQTTARIQECRPDPDEIIVHVNGGDKVSKSLIDKHFSTVKVIEIRLQVGADDGSNKSVKVERIY